MSSPDGSSLSSYVQATYPLTQKIPFDEIRHLYVINRVISH